MSEWLVSGLRVEPRTSQTQIKEYKPLTHKHQSGPILHTVFMCCNINDIQKHTAKYGQDM
jgi:hypothetical protein